MNESSEERHHIWNISEGAVAVFLNYAIPIETLRVYLQGMACPCCGKDVHDDARVMEHIHNACKNQNEISQSVEEFLNHRYNLDIRNIGFASPQTIADELMQLDQPLPKLIGTAWALLTNPEELKRKIGERLIGAILHRGSQMMAEQQPITSMVATVTATHTENTPAMN